MGLKPVSATYCLCDFEPIYVNWSLRYSIERELGVSTETGGGLEPCWSVSVSLSSIKTPLKCSNESNTRSHLCFNSISLEN